MFNLIDEVLSAYKQGVFPMAESADNDHFAFYKPALRALIPITGLHISSKLLKTLKKQPYHITMDTAFADIIDGCAARSETWINGPIRAIFLQLHQAGHAHSIECWTPEGKLAGGLYGLSIGAVFCGESMVSFETDASKIALVHLCALLNECGYTTLDSQFINPHMVQFGTYEILQEDYEALIAVEMEKSPRSLRDASLTHELMLHYLHIKA